MPFHNRLGQRKPQPGPLPVIGETAPVESFEDSVHVLRMDTVSVVLYLNPCSGSHRFPGNLYFPVFFCMIQRIFHQVGDGLLHPVPVAHSIAGRAALQNYLFALPLCTCFKFRTDILHQPAHLHLLATEPDHIRIQPGDFKQIQHKRLHPFQGGHGFGGEFFHRFLFSALLLNDILIHKKSGQRRFQLMGNIGNRILQKFLCLHLGFPVGIQRGCHFIHRRGKQREITFPFGSDPPVKISFRKPAHIFFHFLKPDMLPLQQPKYQKYRQANGCQAKNEVDSSPFTAQGTHDRHQVNRQRLFISCLAHQQPALRGHFFRYLPGEQLCRPGRIHTGLQQRARRFRLLLQIHFFYILHLPEQKEAACKYQT